MAELLSTINVEKKNGATFTKVDGDHFRGKVVALYFSAHWCPPCRHFTPILKNFYTSLAGEPLEIVFVSADQNEEAMKAYMADAHGDWCCIPFGDPAIEDLNTRYSIEGIPTLTIINAKGDRVVEDAVEQVAGDDEQEGGAAPTQSAGDILADWKNKCGL